MDIDAIFVEFMAALLLPQANNLHRFKQYQ